MPTELYGSSSSPPSPSPSRKPGTSTKLPQSGSSLLDNLSSTLPPDVVQQSTSKNGLLPPFPADRSLPTPHSLNSIPRHMHIASPESPSVPLSSRSHSAPHDGSRHLFLPSPVSTHSPLPGRNVGQFRTQQFTPSPSSATLASLSPTMPARESDSVRDAYDVATPGSSPAHNIFRNGELRTPSSPDRVESFPETPALSHAMWEVAHVSSSPTNHRISSRELRIERSLVADDIHTFIGHTRKAPPIIAPPPPPRSHSDDEDFTPSAPSARYSINQEPVTQSALRTHLPSDEMPHHAPPGPSRLPDEQVIHDAPRTPTMRRIIPATRRERLNSAKEKEQVVPDYLQRSKRVRDIADGDATEREEKRFSPGVGVHVSPNNGRRLKLYQPPTPDSRHPLQTAFDEPQTPSRPSNVISSKARAWLETSSPSRPRTKPGNGKKVDKEVKKRKRLAAFQQSEPTISLDIYEVQGRGRILVSSSAAKSLLILSNSDSTPISTRNPPPPPDWPDNHYPWSYVHAAHAERVHAEAEAAQEEGMKWIERFLDRDSDEEDSNDETSSRPSRSVQGSPLRGKPTRPTTTEHVSDARTALFSRHEVQRLTEMQITEPEEDNQSQSGSEQNPEDAEDSDDGIVRCVCGGNEEDRPMVACDRCSIWFHQVCMGIKNSADLDGQEKWYCFDCRKLRTPTPPPPPRQPVFSISSPDTHVRPSLDKPLFQVTPLQRSPGFFPSLDSPSPLRTRDREDRRMPSLLDTPRAPTTPVGRYDRDRDSRMFQTPGFDTFGDGLPPILSFDTPRGGFSLANVPFVTPTQPAHKLSGLPVTPKPSGRVGTLEDSVMSASSPLQRFARIGGDDTPVALRKMPLRDGSPAPGAT